MKCCSFPDRLILAGFPTAGFAFVMATGIVSIATGLVGLTAVSELLYAADLAAFAGACALLAARLWAAPARFVADLRNPGRAPGLFTIVAATCVVGNELALKAGLPGAVTCFWVAGAVLWIGLIYAFFAVAASNPDKQPIETGLDGAWLLVVVVTEAVAIMTTRVAGVVAPAKTVVFASLALFLLGGLFYAVLIGMILYRWLFLPLRPEQVTAPYWINMGAAAIAALAGARLLAALADVPGLSELHPFVLGMTILFWAVASWWIPLVAALGLWRLRASGFSRIYRAENWAIVFPLGMYTTATWRLSHEAGFGFLAAVPDFFASIALLAWVLTFAGMVRAGIGSVSTERRQMTAGTTT